MMKSTRTLDRPMTFRPYWVFWAFMLLYVFGELGFGSLGSVQLSLTNVFAPVAAGLIFLLLMSNERALAFFARSAKARQLVAMLGVFFALELISAILNEAYRPLLRSVADVVAVLAVLLLVHDRKKLFWGLALGSVSVGMLGLLTVLRGLNITKFGLQKAVSYGLAPWERYIHRSIGLPGLNGGSHAVYILALLPLAIMIALEGRRLGIGKPLRAVFAAISLLGAAAILIAAYRSGWLGMAASLVILGLAYYFRRITRAQRYWVAVLLAILLAIGLVFYGARIFTSIYHVAFDVRTEGVQARLIQIEYVWQRITQESWHALLGYGYEDFGNTFIPSLTASEVAANTQLYPWLHNYFLGVLYASGWPAFVLFLLIVLQCLWWLYKQSLSDDPLARIVAVSVLAGLVGCFIVLNFTAALSGLQILWILLAVGPVLEAGSENTEPVPAESPIPESA